MTMCSKGARHGDEDAWSWSRRWRGHRGGHHWDSAKDGVRKTDAAARILPCRNAATPLTKEICSLTLSTPQTAADAAESNCDDVATRREPDAKTPPR